MDAFMTAAGREEGDCEWFYYSQLAGIEGKIPQGKIKASTFVINTGRVLFGLSRYEAERYGGFLVRQIQEWYKTGKKPTPESFQTEKTRR